MSDRLRTAVVLLLALIAAGTVYTYLSGLRQTDTVVVAAVEIPSRTVITPAMIATMTVSKQEREILAPMAIREASQVLGRAPKRPIRKGAVLTLDPDEFYLTPEALDNATDGEAPPAYIIPAGMVAVTIPANEDSAVAYALRNGDLVHVIFTGKGKEGTESKIILSGVKVFAVGGNMKGPSERFNTVTLLVTPEEAERVVLAKRTGLVDLLLTGR